MEEIEKILETTGLSCDELLKKLQFYKTLRTNQSDPTSINTDNETCAETVIIQVDSSNSCNDCSNSNDESKELITQNINTIQCSSNKDEIDRNEDPGGGGGSRDDTARDRNEDSAIAQNTEDSSKHDEQININIEDLDGDSGHEFIAQDLQNKSENLEACKKDEVDESNPDEALGNLKSDKNDSISQSNQDGNEENLQNRSKDQDSDTAQNREKEESYNQSSIQSINEDEDDDNDASRSLEDNEHQEQIEIVSVHDSSDDQDDDQSELSIVNLQSNDEDQDKDDQNDTSNEVGNFEATKENTNNKIASVPLLTPPNRNEDEDRDTANLKNLEDRDEDQSTSDDLGPKQNTNQDLDSRLSQNLQTPKKDDYEIVVIDGDLVSENKDQVEAGSSELVQNIQRINEDRDQDPKSDKNPNNSEASSVIDDIIEDMDVSNQSEEDLINNIKLQLTSLRNKKKTNNYLTDLSTQPLTKFNRFVKKPKQIAEIRTTIDDDDTDNDSLPQESQQSENSGGLITATDETQFVIVNVTGGVDLVEDNQRGKNVEENCPNLLNNFPQMKKVRLNDRIFQENNANNPDNKENLDKSPFISDKLDDFLNENSQLKISYSIPKLGAEDGLMETMKQSPYHGTNYQGNCCGNDRKRRVAAAKDATKPVKIRTLAEMRRHFETIKSNANQDVTEKIRNSYVLYKNQKLWVASRKRDCLCVIEDDSKRAQKQKIANKNDDDSKNATKKLSLLSTLSPISKPIKVHYKPGPLSKKIELQSKESCRYWKTELKNLPKIYLEVIPEINKPIDYRLVHLLPIFEDTIISKERADFALSVLKPPQQEQQVFKFPVAYNNKQQQFLVRRQIVKNNKILQNNKNFDKTDPDVDIKNIVEDMLRYVEIREISDDLIKEDDSKNYNDTNCNNETDNVKKNLIKKKRKRIDFELQRLNCKIINLENDNNNDDQYCNKPYCKLGCVCKSLLCEPILLNHCQLIDCMFECKCPKQQELLLDEHKMNHLNEQVKKNLAKVERDFTQTIIQQGNEMFIVGNTDDNKKAKRTSKAPKRYHDYDYDIDKIFETKPIQPKIDYNLKECRVELINNNFGEIMPYCLEHFDYNCYCGGSMVTPNSAKIDKKPVESSARIRPLISKYRERNKHPVYQKKLFYKKKIVCEQSDDTVLNQPTTSHNNNSIKPSKRKQAFEKIREDLDEHSNDTKTYQPIFEGEIQVPLKHNLDILKIIGPKNAHLEYFRILPWNYLIKGYNQNKLKIWCTVGRSNTLLCNKADVQPPKNCIDIKKLSTNTKLPLPIHNDIIKWIINNKLPRNVFPDETFVILTPTKNHFLLVGFCEKNPTVQERLTTAKSLEQVVSSSSSASSTAISPPEITLTQILPSPSVSPTVAATTENRGMKWKHKDMNNGVKILYITNRYFAPKTFYYNNTENVDVALPKISKTFKWYMVYLNSDFTYLLFTRSKYTIKYTDLMEFINMSKNLHKTIMIRNEQIVKKYMNCTKFGIYCVPQYQDRLFIGPFQCDEDHYIDTLRYINGKLYDTNVFHQIQGKMNNYKKPLWIYEFKRTPLKSDQSIDTIIIDPNNGENEINEPDLDDIDEDDVIIVNDPLITTIDVDDVVVSHNLNTDVVDTDEDIMELLKEFTSENLFMLPFVKLLSTSDIVQRKQTNRYIITNIPHLGYLEAYQHDTKVIDVFWPGDVTAYRFPSVNFAKYSLIQYFSQIFCPINDDYKISVVILNNLDLNANKPMDIRYLTKLAPYICGDFGVYSEEALTPEFLKLHNATSVKSLLRLEQRREENFDRLVQLFGMFLMTSVEQQKFRTTKEILDWAKSEIYVLKRLSANYESEKTDLQYLFRFNCLQIKKLVLPLPLDQRRKYYCRIMEIKRLKRSLINENSFVNKRRRIDDLQVTETIEIKDSDDEDNQMEKTVEKTVEKPKNDMKVERLVKLARVGTVIQPLFQPINSSGVIQPATSYRSLLKNKFVPGKTLLIAKNCSTSDFKVVKKHEIVTNQDSPTKIVNIVNNISPEPT